MNNKQLFRGQFLLAKENTFSLEWPHANIGEFNLFYHPALNYTTARNKDIELHLLGDMYDWEVPSLSNGQILTRLAEKTTFEESLNAHSKFAGQFVLIYKNKDKLYVLNDACAQNEIYFDTSFTAFASQTKLLGRIIELEPYEEDYAQKFFQSPSFLSKKVFVGFSSHMKNVKHLLPNHYIDVTNNNVERFFPSMIRQPLSINDAALKAGDMIKGFIKAVSYRDKIALAVTGGYDSRVLFLASFDVDCRYFVSRRNNMSDRHHDIIIPQKLTKLFGKEFSIIPDIHKSQIKMEDDYVNSVDFPRRREQASRYFKNHTYLNGNISEIARNYYGYHKHVSPEDLAALSGYANERFVIKEYKKWLDASSKVFSRYGYNILDMFYWENRMGTWLAKAKTEETALGRKMFSPFCSRELLLTLLATPRKYRDSHRNRLYDQIIKSLSPKSFKIPINPDRKQNMIRLLKKMRIYNLYRHIGLKFRLLK